MIMMLVRNFFDGGGKEGEKKDQAGAGKTATAKGK